MDAIKFNDVINQLHEHSTAVLVSKGNEYATDANRLINFQNAGHIFKLINPNILQYKPATIASFGMMLKHFISIIDIINSKTPVTEALAQEKFGDMINYLHLIYCNLIEEGTIPE